GRADEQPRMALRQVPLPGSAPVRGTVGALSPAAPGQHTGASPPDASPRAGDRRRWHASDSPARNKGCPLVLPVPQALAASGDIAPPTAPVPREPTPHSNPAKAARGTTPPPAPVPAPARRYRGPSLRHPAPPRTRPHRY